jgi:hypothetical protein
MPIKNPSEHAAETAAKHQAVETSIEKRKREEVKLRAAVDTVLRTEAGQLLWKWLFYRCGYNATSLVRKPDGEIAELATHCKEAQRLIYLQLRTLVSVELLHEVEIFAEKLEVEGEQNAIA